MKRTFLAPESDAYTRGGQTRHGRAIYPDGIVRRVWGGIADTFFTIPAHGRWRGKYVRGHLYLETDQDKPDYGEFIFFIYTDSPNTGVQS